MKNSIPCVLITLNSQSTSNESNSACWNGLHPVLPSNFTNKSFWFLKQSDWNFHQTFSHMSWIIPENFSPAIWEKFANERQDSHSPRPHYRGLQPWITIHKYREKARAGDDSMIDTVTCTCRSLVQTVRVRNILKLFIPDTSVSREVGK